MGEATFERMSRRVAVSNEIAIKNILTEVCRFQLDTYCRVFSGTAAATVMRYS